MEAMALLEIRDASPPPMPDPALAADKIRALYLEGDYKKQINRRLRGFKYSPQPGCGILWARKSVEEKNWLTWGFEVRTGSSTVASSGRSFALLRPH